MCPPFPPPDRDRQDRRLNEFPSRENQARVIFVIVAGRTIDARTLRIQLLRAELEATKGGERFDPVKVLRPKKRSECVEGIRPCPFVGCRNNLYLEVTTKGGLKMNFPELEPGDMNPHESCVLDVADSGAQSLYAVGRLLNVTRERARQLEDAALARVTVAATVTLTDFTER